MCAAQWAAVQAGVGVAAAPERAVAAQNAWDVKQVASIAATSLLEVADIWPAFVTARFLQPVRTALELLLQVGCLSYRWDLKQVGFEEVTLLTMASSLAVATLIWLDTQSGSPTQLLH